MKKITLILILSVFMFQMNAQVSYVAEQYWGGQIYYKGTLAGNQKTGLWQYFYQNGQLKDIGYYADDKKTGEWKYYYNSGTLESVGYYSNGQKTGSWKYYHKDGKLARTEEGSYERRNDDPLVAGIDSQVQISQVEPSSKVFVQGVDYSRTNEVERKKEFTDKEEVITSRNDFAGEDVDVQTYSG